MQTWSTEGSPLFSFAVMCNKCAFPRLKSIDPQWHMGIIGITQANLVVSQGAELRRSKEASDVYYDRTTASRHNHLRLSLSYQEKPGVGQRQVIIYV